MQKLLTILLSIFFLSCTPQKAYVIKKGNHESDGASFRLVKAQSLHFFAKFDQSAVYQTIDPSNQADLNKLYGFSDCNSPHHENSARLAWRWFQDRLEIHAYVYINGTRESQYLGEAQIGKEFRYGISIVGNRYVFVMGDSEISLGRGCSDTGSIKYRLYPYFGGDEVAPHDIRVLISEIDDKYFKGVLK